ncbi:MAG: DUF2135 domain-containing protein [Kiritimatiellae bacterium]|nr:DUF2135 domain-containing protein [Kiritimatiellia bacterium]
MNRKIAGCLAMGIAASVFGHVMPAPQIVPPLSQAGGNEPVKVEAVEDIVADNGLFRKVQVAATFTNPNSRQMAWDWEYTLPDGATVCGYKLEIAGAMIPGVVVEKEKARVAFETEKAKRIDPGIVEQVKGNLWRTRIFPLEPGIPRRAEITYIMPLSGEGATIYESDGDDLFEGRRSAVDAASEQSVRCECSMILWDASSSAAAHAQAWRAKVEEKFPQDGKWRFMAFRNEPDAIAEAEGKDELLKLIDAVVYDGATDIDRAYRAVKDEPGMKAIFSDETATWGSERNDYESDPQVLILSRKDVTFCNVVRKLKDGEKIPDGAEVKSGTLLATAWAAQRVERLAEQAAARKDELLALGRRYGVASSVTSLIVLENLEQYIKHKIEPPKEMAFHSEWVKQIAAQDDPIRKREERLAHEKELLALWKERVEWWNNPIPKTQTPTSGLFNRVASVGAVRTASAPVAMEERGAVAMEMAEGAVAAGAARAIDGTRANAPASRGGAAMIAITPWNPAVPYLKRIESAQDAYGQYLAEKKEYGSSPAFFMDAAGVFFKKGDTALGVRVLSNMAEFKLEDAAVLRAMAWRLREAGDYDDAIALLRKVVKLRGEEGQSRRDLALLLAECGKDRKCAKYLGEAAALLHETAFTPWARRSGRRSNDHQVSIVALEELNALATWCKANGVDAEMPELSEEFVREMPLKLRIVLSWDADETDVDLHVLEPNGEEAYYGHRRTSRGGFSSEDVTTGYGPEEYLRKDADAGVYRVLAHYFASHQTALTGATAVSATVYTDWATANEKRAILTLRLDKPKDKVSIGEITIAE